MVDLPEIRDDSLSGQASEHDIEIIIEEDTPEGDRGRWVAPEDAPAEARLKDEEEEYVDPDTGETKRRKKGPSAQERIKALTAEREAERRAKDAVVRERDEAIRFAQQQMEQARLLKQQTVNYEQGFVYQSRAAADAAIESSSIEYAQAHETGDVNRMITAQRKLTAAQVEKSRFDGYVPTPVEQAPQVQQNVPQAQPQISPTELALQTKFIRENPWLNTDAEMTQKALEVDAQFRSGYPHLVGTPEYYEFIDTWMRNSFPEERFGSRRQAAVQEQPRQVQRTQNVAPVSRSGPGKTPRKVTLTPSMLRMAKRLNLTPQQYAEAIIEHGQDNV